MPGRLSRCSTANFRYGILAWITLLLSLEVTIRGKGRIVRVILGTDAAIKIEKIKQFFESFGKAAPLVYVLCVTIEVMIAPLPGLMLYARRLYIRRFQGGLTVSSGKYFRQWRLLRGTQKFGQ